MYLFSISRYRHLKRYRQIVLVFVKHGFGSLLDRWGIFAYLDMRKKILLKKNAGPVKKFSLAERLRLALEELGPTFVKLGQILSTRPDILNQDIRRELEKLQDSVIPFSFQSVRQQVEAEFDAKLEELYSEFEEKPLAAASIAQVHSARLKSGRKVVVKVQRPGIDRLLELDLRILQDLASFFDHHTQYGNLYDFGKMVGEFEETLKNELDFRIEGENAEKFRQNFVHDKGVAVPEIIWAHTSRHVLTQEYIDGTGVRSAEMLAKAGLSPKIVARRIAASVFNQVLRDGFFHGDPHPGNILILPGNTVVFLDLGMVGKMNEERKTQFLKMLVGISYKNSRLIVQALVDLDAMKGPVNTKRLEKEIDLLRDKFFAVPLHQVKLGGLFNEIFSLALQYKVKLPGEFTMLAKTLVTLEGLVEKLDPELSILEIAEPIAGKLAFKIYSFDKVKSEIVRSASDYGRLIKDLPVFAYHFFKKLEEGDYALQHKMEVEEGFIRRVERIANRIFFSMILLAVSIVIAGITIGSGYSARTGDEVYLLNLNVLRAGLCIAGLIIAGLVVSILKKEKR